MNRVVGSLLLVLLSAPSVSRAFYVESRDESVTDGGTPAPLVWETDDPVEFRIAAEGAEEVETGAEHTFPLDEDDALAAIRAAFDTWGSVPCSTLSFEEGERSDQVRRDPMVTDEKFISVYFTADPGLWTNNRVGVFLFTDDTEGHLINGVIALNTKDHSWSTTGESGKLDLESIVSALLGRSLGITSDMEGNATYPSYAPGDTTKRELGEDDIAAVRYLYGESCSGEIEEPQATCTMFDGATPCPPVPDIDGADGGTRDAAAGDDDDDDDDDATGDDDDDGCGCVVARKADMRGHVAGLAFVGAMIGLRIARRRRKR